MLDAGQISKADINEFDIFFLDVCKDFCCVLKHASPNFTCDALNLSSLSLVRL
jgi:hypothetical protein